MHESEVAQSCPTLSDSMDCSLPGSSVHGIFQARVLEWVAIVWGGGVGKLMNVLQKVIQAMYIKILTHHSMCGASQVA